MFSAKLLSTIACVLVIEGNLICIRAIAQTEETKADTKKLSSLITDKTGIPTVAAVVPSQEKYDIDIVFMGPITNYQGVMGVVIGSVGQLTNQCSYRTNWCYIRTRERGVDRIKTADLRTAQKLALQGDLQRSWQHFLKKLENSPKP